MFNNQRLKKMVESIQDKAIAAFNEQGHIPAAAFLTVPKHHILYPDCTGLIELGVVGSNVSIYASIELVEDMGLVTIPIGKMSDCNQKLFSNPLQFLTMKLNADCCVFIGEMLYDPDYGSVSILKSKLKPGILTTIQTQEGYWHSISAIYHMEGLPRFASPNRNFLKTDTGQHQVFYVRFFY